MAQITINLTPEQLRILGSDIADINDWINNVIDNKLRQVSDKIIKEHTKFQPHKLTLDEKREIILPIPLVLVKDKLDDFVVK